MWLFAGIGFYSIVSKPDDKALDTLTVRARRAEDLDALRVQYLPELGSTQFDPRADYAYRAKAPRDRVQAAVAAVVGDLNYDDFKSHVERTQGTERAIIYNQVWLAMRRLQLRIPTIFAGIGRQRDVLDDADDH